MSLNESGRKLNSAANACGEEKRLYICEQKEEKNGDSPVLVSQVSAAVLLFFVLLWQCDKVDI